MRQLFAAEKKKGEIFKKNKKKRGYPLDKVCEKSYILDDLKEGMVCEKSHNLVGKRRNEK
jgi:hypothetical protein